MLATVSKYGLTVHFIALLASKKRRKKDERKESNATAIDEKVKFGKL